MYRRRQERRKRILQKIIRWHPVILLLIMFVLGACTRGKTNSYTITAASAAEASAAETVAMAQENFAEFERIDDSLAENPAYASAAQVQIVAFTEPAQVPSSFWRSSTIVTPPSIRMPTVSSPPKCSKMYLLS